MGKSISARQKRRGRPATGKTPSVTIRLPDDLTERLDIWAAKHGFGTRSDAIRQLLEQALAAPKAATDRKALEREVVLKEQIEAVFAPKAKPKAKTPAKAKAKAKGRK